MSVVGTLQDQADLAALPVQQLLALDRRLQWLEEARWNQVIVDDPSWNIHLLLAGRGFGKTRCAAEDLGWYAWQNPGIIGHYLGPTFNDLRAVCAEGPSGFLNTIPPECVADYNRSMQELRLTNGSLLRGYSAQDPNRLRGPQCHRLWGDELAAWDQPAGNAQAVFDMAMLGLRLGRDAKAVFTTTPKPIKLLRTLLKRSDVKLVHGTTLENLKNLADNFKRTVLQFDGTELGKQEIYAQLLDPADHGIIKKRWFGLYPALDARERPVPLPRFELVLMSVDSAFTDKTFDTRTQEPDYTAVTVWGLYKERLSAQRKLLLLDCWRERLGFDEFLDRFHEESAFTYGSPEREIDVVLFEDIGAGRLARQQLRKVDFRVDWCHPGGNSKLTRLHAVSPMIRHGLVELPESTRVRGEPRDWCDPLLDEICYFHGDGTTEHDDVMDSATQALNWFQHRGLVEVPLDLNITPPPDEPLRFNRPRNPYLGEGRPAHA